MTMKRKYEMGAGGICICPKSSKSKRAAVRDLL